MPTYNFRCSHCDHAFEKNVPLDTMNQQHWCPHCNKQKAWRLFSPPDPKAMRCHYEGSADVGRLAKDIGKQVEKRQLEKGVGPAVDAKKSKKAKPTHMTPKQLAKEARRLY